MKNIKYYLVNASVLPQTYAKVIEAKSYLASGEAKSAKKAAEMAGLSRSTYYKYKDMIFEYNGEDSDETVTISAKLKDNAGVLSALMNEIFKAGANVLSVNQNVPVNYVADVSVTVRITQMTISVDELVNNIKGVNGVNSVKLGI